MAKLAPMANLEMSDEDKIDAIKPMAVDTPDYPYGLRICLTHRELEKLDLDDDVEVGDFIDMRCFGEVTAVSKNAGPNGENSCRVEIQITRMRVESEDRETI